MQDCSWSVNQVDATELHIMEFGFIPGDIYAGYVVDDSDLEFSDCPEEESSDDERVEVSCSGHDKCSRTGHTSESESEDEFEREMDKELESKIQLMVSPNVAEATNIIRKKETAAKQDGESSQTESAEEAPSKHESQTAKAQYDDIYFDSSDSGGEEDDAVGNIRNVGKKVCKLSNDELFYDPGMDDEDERWVNRQRMAYHNVEVARSLEKEKKIRDGWPMSSSSANSTTCGAEAGTKGAKKPVEGGAQAASLPKSDAVLNCPACMSTLCLDCQRHESYVNQYRAMFVLNCLIVREQTLSYKPKPDKKRRKRRRQKEIETGEPSSYHPVRCCECNTEVAVYDQDEVFHFFNVLASAPT